MDYSLSREVAMKLLFAASLGGEDTLEQVLEQSEAGASLSNRDKTFVDNLVYGVNEHQQELDAIITPYVQGWTMDRLGKVDLILLRMAVYEIKFMPQIPVGASINEAVELAKHFGGDKSPSFINGILGNLSRDIANQ
ncbi:MAG: transcription antitermination factor NusB [Clostridia bacterium]|nr:transcription antitermination factor NusB [Clostridia bacterium]